MSLITHASIIRVDTPNLLVLKCGACSSKRVPMAQQGSSILGYCPQCQRLPDHTECQLRCRLLVHADDTLQQYTMTGEALELFVGCDANTFRTLLDQHPDVGEHVRERLEGLHCHLAVCPPSEGRAQSGLPVIEQIIPIMEMQPVLTPWLSRHQGSNQHVY